jgi:tetratricopeptide (TPR) repeat protein
MDRPIAASRYFLLLILPFALEACATTKPKGQVVRLQNENGESAPAPAAKAEEDGPLYALSRGEGDSLAVPTNHEDAAIFHFSLGQAYSLDNDPQRAIESYRATLVHDPKSSLVRARLAAELVKIGNLAEAKTLCEESIRLDSKYVDSYLLIAGIEVAAKEYDKAVDTYAKALKVEPKNRDALLYLGVTLAEVGREKEGVATLEKLVKLKESADSNIDRSVALYYLAKVYEQSGHKDKAIQSFQSALKHRPGFAKAALALADIYFERHEDRKAYQVMAEAFDESRSPELAERLAERHLEKNDFKSAVVYLETLVEEDPSNQNMKLRLALVYWQIKWLDKAQFLLSELHDRYPASSEITFYLGELELERNQPEAALAYYREVSPEYAKYDQMVSRVVFVYRQQNKNNTAELFLADAMKKRPDIVAFYPLLAALYEDEKRLAEARETLEQGEKLFPNDENILYYLGFTYDRLGKKEPAMLRMRRLLELNPNNANALNFLGYTLLEGGKELAEARGYLERAVKLKPDDPFVLDSYGWLLYRLGKSQDAMKQLEKAYSAKPGEGVIAEHLADVYVALNMPRKALAVYEKALQGGGDQEFVARVQVKMANLRETLAGNSVSSPKADALPFTAREPASR